MAADAPAPAQLSLSGRASSPRQRRAPSDSPPSTLAGVHSGLRPRPGPGRGGSGINHARAGSSAPLLSSWPLWGRTCGPRRSPWRLQSCSPAGPRGRPCTQRSWLGVSFCLCVVRVVTVTKPPATWPGVWPGCWLRHPWPGQGFLKYVEAAVAGCRGGVGTHRTVSPLPSPRPGSPGLSVSQALGAHTAQPEAIMVSQACSHGIQPWGPHRRDGRHLPALPPTSSTH